MSAVQAISTEISSTRIMVIDDDGFILKLVGCILEDLGFCNLVSFDSGRSALAAYDSTGQLPEIIMLDLNMPEMDGIEVVRHLGERKFKGSLLFLSGEGDLLLRTAERLAVAHDLAMLQSQSKPFSREALLSVLADHGTRAPKSGARRSPSARKVYSVEEIEFAISNNQLVNHYQPKADVSTGEVVGVESLVRWNHPTDGLVYPDQFIPIAERSGCIRALTREVVRNSLIQAKKWRDDGLKLTVSINVTMDDLASVDFADYMIAQAKAVGVEPSSVVLEVTESQLIPNLLTVLDVLARLRLHRFGLSIDDFGTGNSSLVQLRDLPFDELKIDRSFTSNAGSNARLGAFVRSGVQLATALGLATVAEGIENAEDLEYVRSVGCTVSQGYFIARPMPALELLPWLDTWETRLQHEPLLRTAA